MIKPTVLLLLVFGICGYLILSQNYKTRFSYLRSSGYHTFFWSTSVGLVLFIVSAFVFWCAIQVATCFDIKFDFGRWLLNSAFQVYDVESETVATFNISAISLALSGLYASVKFFMPGRTEKLKKEFVKDADSPELTRLFGFSSHTGIPVLFTMSDRKVFCGYIYEMQAAIHTSDIHILPVFSGFRDEKNLSLKKVTMYREVVNLVNRANMAKAEDELIVAGMPIELAKTYVEVNSENYESWDKFTIALPLREIIHAHLHDITHEEDFRREELKLATRLRNQLPYQE
ncbi:hypothetical protein ABMY44_04760 [Pseudoalteromonas sp. Cnat2-41]|uniref:hypothetical protein n=1 Tax=unclassified Pseudoalteromonas TaxID=194690 RepID=UPI001EF77AC4|nr:MULTISPECIES: hypothetical protein [unclassified Pseudoalteromonas]MCF2861467.1 hypothetical protein [Pseudoalteromonas sp. CNAT2-18]MCG7557494.1 hypothetical protein [Pseudoalteromonas sp. CNAT2-18.1]